MSRKNKKNRNHVNHLPSVATFDFNRDFAEKRKIQADNIGGVKSSGSGKNLTADSFANFVAKLGIQSSNLSSSGYYALGPYITRNRIELEAAYRENWLVGKIIDCVAEDMTRDGIQMNSELEPDDIQKIQSAISELKIWKSICSALKWSRLYGGALAVILIDGADNEKALNVEAVGKDRFKGLAVLDRWMIQPEMGDLITEVCPEVGMPKFYQVLPGVSVFPTQKLHYTRVLRFDGIELPYYQKLFENLWGLSVVERMLDRLIAFDSATQGAAQLVYKSFLRIIGIDGFREALAIGGPTENAVIKQFEYIRAMQTNEGLTVLDAKDTFNVHSNTFAGLPDLLQQFGQQISGAEGIPLVRLFGQSPAGFSATGESDLRNYYDEIKKRQENDIRPQLDMLLKVISMSTLGKPLPEDFEYDFVSLWQMSEREKSEIASADSTSISNLNGAGLLTKKQSLMELRQSSRVTDRFTNITEEDIDNAEDEPPEAPAPDEGEGKEDKANLSPELGEQSEKELERSINEPIQEREKEDREKLQSRDRISWRDIFGRFKSRKEKIKKTLDEFKESEHPRGTGEKGGQFVAKGTGSGTPATKAEKKEEKKVEVKTSGEMVGTKIVEGKRVNADGSELPKHIRKLRLPPAWTDVTYSSSPDAELLAKGKDAKGRVQYVYSDAHWDNSSKMKFARIHELHSKFNSIREENEKNLKGKNAEEATILKLIMDTGIRPGSDEDTKAEKKAYGATTILGKHVIETDNGVELEFIGKKGVLNKILITDKELANEILERAKNVGDKGKVFKCSNVELLKYSSSLDGGKFKTKDFRTLLGTKTAMEVIQKIEKPKNEKEYKKAVSKVAKTVAAKLGNTPAIALKSYISPIVFADWR